MKKIILFFSFIVLCFLGHSQWSQTNTFTGIGRNHPVVFIIGDTAYAATGYNTLSNSLLDDFYKYDPKTDQWTTMPDFPGGNRGFAVGSAYNGKGYLGFGTSNNAYLDDLWEFDPTTNSWTELASCPCLGRRHPAFAITENGKIYLGLGDGRDANSQFNSGFKDWWVYDIETDTWQQLEDLPNTGRHHPYYFALGNQVYVGFGHKGGTIFKDFYVYDGINNTWTQLSDFPGESRVAGAHFTYNGFGYIVDGDGSDHQNLDEGEFYKYDHVNDEWMTLPSHGGDGLWAPSAFVYEDAAYVFGGDDDNDNSSTGIWKYDFSGTGITPQENNGEISIYPNPADNLLHVSGLSAELTADYVISDFSGRTVGTGKLDSRNPKVNLTELPEGVYHFRLAVPNTAISSLKLVINR